MIYYFFSFFEGASSKILKYQLIIYWDYNILQLIKTLKNLCNDDIESNIYKRVFLVFEKNWVLIEKWNLTKTGFGITNGDTDLCFYPYNLQYLIAQYHYKNLQYRHCIMKSLTLSLFIKAFSTYKIRARIIEK